MFIGHWAPALAVAAGTRNPPRLVLLCIAAQLVDWAFFLFLLLGLEHMRFSSGITVMNPMDLFDMPYSHSLIGTAVFAAGFGTVVLVMTKDRSAALLAAAVVLSHWLLDLLVHAPDLTLAGSPPKLGLALWNHPWVEMPLELGISFGALAWYVRARRPDVLPSALFGCLLLAFQAVNWFVPVGTEVTVATSLLAFFAFGSITLAAWWMDRNSRLARQS